MAALCLMGTAAQAQQNLSWGQGPQVASPDVHADNSVTFNLIAPEAQKVQITGDFLPTQKIKVEGYGEFDAPGVVDLVKNDKGVWSFTSEPLKPELYTYNMMVDGVKIIDPLNVYNIRDINNLFSVLLIGGDARTDLYKVNKVALLATRLVVRSIQCFTCCMVLVATRTPGVSSDVLPRLWITSLPRVRLSLCLW